jgi:ATP-dependent RNA helicase RhlE
VHRIGRTGRAGSSGVAISLCDNDELPYIRDIQKLISMRIPVVSDHAYHLSVSVQPMTQAKPAGQGQKQAHKPQSGQNQGRKKRFERSRFRA